MLHQLTASDVVDFIDTIAPFKNTDVYDNTGLLVGEKNAPVSRILLALDVTNEVIDEALKNNCDLILTHHPAIFDPLKTLSVENVAVRMLKCGISHISAHTNLDVASGGVSDAMAELLGIKNTGKVFELKRSEPYLQVAVFVPTDSAETVYNAMCLAGGGEQGNYKGCAFSSEGVGRFVPLENSNAYIGEVGKLEKTAEVRVEMLVKPSKLDGVISAMRKAHPYEEPAFTIEQNNALSEEIGYGKLCECEPMTADELAELVRDRFNCTCVRFTDGGRKIQRLAVCSGAGGNQTDLAIAMGLDAYITGDVKHDQFISAKNAGLTLIDGGHFHTENIILPYLKQQLNSKFGELAFITQTAEPYNYKLK